MSTPQVKIVSDEEDKAIQGLVDEKVKSLLSKAMGHLPGVIDPRLSANFKNWQNGLTASPFGDTAGEVAPEENGDAYNFRSMVKQLVASPQYKSFARTGASRMEMFEPNVKLYGDRRDALVATPKGFLSAQAVNRAAQMTGVSDGRAVLSTEYDTAIKLAPFRKLHIRDLLHVVPVSKGDEKFLQETGFTNGTIMMPENTDPASTTSITASTMGVQMVSVNIKEIATKITVPVQYLEDTNEIESFLEGRLEQMGFDSEDAQILNGDGTGNNYKGFYPDSACQALLWSAGLTGDTQIDAVLNAMVLSWVVNFEPDGSILHPQDWAKMAKMKDANKRYLIDGVHQGNFQKTLWNLPVVPSVAHPTGKVLVGSFASSAVLYDRMQPVIEMSRDHSDNRDKSLATFFLRMRGALAKFRPEAFVRLTLDGAPA